MPNATMEDEPEFKLPADIPLPARLVKVEEKSYPYTKNGEERTFTKWSWDFEITDGDYAGLHAWGDTDPKLTNHPENKVRQWGETLRGAPFEMGEGIDTDDLLDLPCLVLVDNIIDQKKGSTDKFYRCPVVDVLPADMDVEPPF